MSGLDFDRLPRLVEILDRGDDPTTLVDPEHLADRIDRAVTTTDDDRAESAFDYRRDALGAWFFPNQEDGHPEEWVLEYLWGATLIEQPSLVQRVLGAVRDPATKIYMDHRYRESLAVRDVSVADDARQVLAWREPPEGKRWHSIGDWSVELFATEPQIFFDRELPRLAAATSTALCGFAPHLEVVLRQLVPAGTDVQVKVDR